MTSRTPAIQTPREFGTESGIRAARAAVDAIRIRLERLESALDTNGEALERQRRALTESISRVAKAVARESALPAAICCRTENHTATPEMLAERRLWLAAAPADPLAVVLMIHHGIEQKAGIDFIVNDTVLSWAGLALQTLLESGDSFSVRYLA